MAIACCGWLGKKGYFKKPDRQDFIDVVSAAWERVDVQVIKNSFRGAEFWGHDDGDNGENKNVNETSMIECSFSDSELEDMEESCVNLMFDGDFDVNDIEADCCNELNCYWN